MNILRKLFLTLIFSAGLNAEWDFPNEEILISGRAQKFLHVGIDTSGNAITVWDNDTSAQVLASNWNGTAWLPVAPHTVLATSSDQSDLAVSANGTALAVWRDASGPFLASAAFWDGSSWVNNGSISSGNTAKEPLVVMNASGIGFAIWTGNTLGADIQTNRWNGSSWTVVQNVTTGFNTKDPSIGIDASGNAVAIWEDSSDQIFSSTWKASAGSVWVAFGTPLSAVNCAVLSNNRGLGVDEAGNAVAMWANKITGILESSTYDSSSNMWTPTTDSVATGFLGTPNAMLAVSSGGQAIAIYIDNTSGDLFSRALNGLTWDAPILIESAASANMPVNVIMDSTGNAITTWLGGDDLFKAATWDGAEWSDPETLYSLDTNQSFFNSQDSAINTNGEAVVAWGIDFFMALKDSNGLGFAPTSDFIATIFGDDFFPSTIPLAPSDFAGRVEKNKFLTQTEHINFLTWAPSADTSVVGYRVYEGESIVAEVSSEGPFEAVIHNRIKNFPYTYRLVAFNASGLESDPLILNVN